jgi:hypothetical protein
MTSFSKISLIRASSWMSKPGVAVGAQKAHHQRLDGGMGGAVGVRRHTGVDDVHAGLDGLEVAHGRHAGGEVAVQVNGQLDSRLEGLDGIGIVGGDQAGHVLDADGLSAPMASRSLALLT